MENNNRNNKDNSSNNNWIGIFLYLLKINFLKPKR